MNFTGGGQHSDTGIAIDAAGNVWVANQDNPGSVTELNSSGTPLSPSTGFTGAGQNIDQGVALDQAGNVWVANFGNNSVAELIGAAAPVKCLLSGPPQSP